MKRTMMMIGASLLVAACGDRKSDIKKAFREMASEDADSMKKLRYVASMKSDLRNLVTAEEAYFADHVKYTANPEQAGFRLNPGSNNSLSPITLVGGGWTATIQNPNTRQVCAIFVGTKTPIPPATEEGVPACR